MTDARTLLPPPPRRSLRAFGSTIGAQLRAAREMSGASVEAICAKTRLSRQVILALEADRFDEVGGDFYVRGFLRQLADHLGLDAEGLVEAFDARRMPGLESATLPAVQTPSWLRDTTPTSRGLSPAQIFFLIVTVVTAVVFMLAAQRKREGRQLAGPAAISVPEERASALNGGANPIAAPAAEPTAEPAATPAAKPPRAAGPPTPRRSPRR